MEKKKAVLLIMAFTIVILAGCTANLESSSSATTNSSKPIVNSTETKTQANSLYNPTTADYYYDWQKNEYTSIVLGDEPVSITKSGVYVLSGKTDGSVTVNVDKTTDSGTVYLVLNGADITNQSDTPINIIEAKKAVIILGDGTVNNITQGSITTTDENFPSAAVFSKADTVITGAGTLNINTAYNDGITSRDDLVVTDGTINITAAQDGIVGKDLLYCENATITIDCGKDAMRATNATEEGKGNLVIANGNYQITAVDDGVKAEKTVQISGGNINILASYEGIEGSNIEILGGNIDLVASNDGINVNSATGTMTFAGGDIFIKGGGDGIDSNGSIVVLGGDITIDTSTVGQMDSPIDYDGTFTQTGGTLVDQNGSALNTEQHMPGGGGGGKGGSMGGARPERNGQTPAQMPNKTMPPAE